MADTGGVDCIVVGGGLLGMLTARALHREGLSVSVLERGAAGRESSWAGGGILSPLIPWQYADAVSELVVWSQQFYPDLVQQLLDDTGVDAEWLQSGLLLLNTALDDAPREWASRNGRAVETLSPAGVHECDPQLAPVGADSVLLPEVAQIRNPLLCTALARSIQLQGIRLLENTGVTGLEIKSGRVTGIRTAGGVMAAGQVVIASGAWSAQVMQLAGLELAVEPVRGQMIMYQTVPGLLRHITLDRGHYLIPRQNGLVLVGSTLEYVGFNKDTTATARAELQDRALALMPALADYDIVRHWAGLRPGTKDNIPFIGEHPKISGLFVNAGHFRNGVVMAPASAQLLVDCMLERPSFTPFEPYSL